MWLSRTWLSLEASSSTRLGANRRYPQLSIRLLQGSRPPECDARSCPHLGQQLSTQILQEGEGGCKRIGRRHCSFDRGSARSTAYAWHRDSSASGNRIVASTFSAETWTRSIATAPSPVGGATSPMESTSDSTACDGQATDGRKGATSSSRYR